MKKSGLSVLVIDDDEATNFISRMVLEEAGIQERLMFMDSASEALSYLSKLTDRSQYPDLILLDINMPGMDGWEFADELARMKLASGVITVMFSTSDTNSDCDRANAHPAIATFQQKPLTPEIIDGIIEKFFVNVGTR